MLIALILSLVMAEGTRPTTVRDWIEVRDFQQRDLLMSHLTGVMIGLKMSSKETGSKLFCAPSDVRQDGPLADSLLRRYANAHPDVLDRPLDPVLLRAAQDAFPCPTPEQHR